MKVLNLDKVKTRRDIVIVLGGVEHSMKSPTVKDYIEQMKRAESISKLSEENSLESASKMMELTIDTLRQSFPTVTRDDFESLTVEQLEALRELAEGSSEDEAPKDDEEGEATGKED